MKNKNILTLVLLFAMSFQVVHAFAIDMLDTHQCEVSEYVTEFSQDMTIELDGDVCDIHAGFHHAFITPELTTLKNEALFRTLPHSFIASYDYNPTKNFLIPPRNI